MGKKGKSLILSILSFLLAGGIALAIWKIPDLTGEGRWEYFTRKGNELGQYIGKILDWKNNKPNINIGKPNDRKPSENESQGKRTRPTVGKPTKQHNDQPSIDIEKPDISISKPTIRDLNPNKPDLNIPGIDISGTTEEYLNMVNNLRVQPDENVQYNRRDWKHWRLTSGQACWNAREEVLYNQAEPGSQVLLDKNKQPTNDKSQACYITSGVWKDFYSGKTIKEASKIDIDHVVALGEVARKGGIHWDASKKEDYANDFENLLAVSASENRSKSDLPPNKWLPSDKNFHKDYIKLRIKILNKYDLSVTEEEKVVMQQILQR